MLFQGGKNGWCRVGHKKVRPHKNWGFCSDLCNIDGGIDGYTNTLKETQLTVLPVKDCAGFNSSILSYDQKRELCAGNKIDYPPMKVYIRKKGEGPLMEGNITSPAQRIRSIL